jgi:hypothetical protein
MILETYENEVTGFKSHVCMIKMNDEIHFTVDIYDVKEKIFLPLVKVFKPNEKEKAKEFAKDAISA